MSARPEDIARLEAMERRRVHTHARPLNGSEHRAKMLCADCTLTPVVDLLTEAEIRETLKPLTDQIERCPECRHAPHGTLGFCPNTASDNDCACTYRQPSRPIIFEDPGPAADKHTWTVDGAAAYDRQRSARDGDQS